MIGTRWYDRGGYSQGYSQPWRKIEPSSSGLPTPRQRIRPRACGVFIEFFAIPGPNRFEIAVLRAAKPHGLRAFSNPFWREKRCLSKVTNDKPLYTLVHRLFTAPKNFKSACHEVERASYCAPKPDYLMADVANKYPENVAGKYYVDNQCIDCDLCRETAPDNFKRNEDGGYSFVYKQPESPEEEARCKEAKEGCPVEAIGDNGA
jgi:ferredoxin